MIYQPNISLNSFDSYHSHTQHHFIRRRHPSPPVLSPARSSPMALACRRHNRFYTPFFSIYSASSGEGRSFALTLGSSSGPIRLFMP